MSTKFDPCAYSIEIRRGSFEGEICFQARVLEFPDLYEYEDSFEAAYRLAVEAIAMTVAALAEQGKQIPEPMRSMSVLTADTLAKSERGEDVHRAKDVDDLFGQLGI